VQSRTSIEALVLRNAIACEEAKRPECRCRCKGTFHGKAHSAKWIAREVEAIVEELTEEEQQLDLPIAKRPASRT
jgi:hypothetical protein